MKLLPGTVLLEKIDGELVIVKTGKGSFLKKGDTVIGNMLVGSGHYKVGRSNIIAHESNILATHERGEKLPWSGQ